MPIKKIKPELETEFILEQLIGEYSRITGGFYQAINNYYSVLPFLTSLFTLIIAFFNGTQLAFLYPFIPFLLLLLLFVEAQIRTTITCSAQYLSLLESRINKIANFPLLTYESKFTVGKVLYYTFNKHALLKYLAYLPFVIIGTATYFISVAKFYELMTSFIQNGIILFGKSFSSMAVFNVYLVILGITTAAGGISWLDSFIFPLKIYKKRIAGILVDVEKEEKKSSKRDRLEKSS